MSWWGSHEVKFFSEQCCLSPYIATTAEGKSAMQNLVRSLTRKVIEPCAFGNSKFIPTDQAIDSPILVPLWNQIIDYKTTHVWCVCSWSSCNYLQLSHVWFKKSCVPAAVFPIWSGWGMGSGEDLCRVHGWLQFKVPINATFPWAWFLGRPIFWNQSACARHGKHMFSMCLGAPGEENWCAKIAKGYVVVDCNVKTPRILLNHGLLIRGYSPNSHDLILKWYLPN